MATQQTPPANGGPKIWGIPVAVISSFIQTTGIATIIVVFLMWIIAQYVPPWLKSQINLMDRTGAALEGVEASLEDSTEILHELKEAGEESREFRAATTLIHSKQVDLLDKQTALIFKACEGHDDTQKAIEEIRNEVCKPK